MKRTSLGMLVALALGCGTVKAEERQAGDQQSQRAFVWRGIGYFHRWSKNDQHEFTPTKQEDLKKWSDMITLNGYPDVRDGERLATTANAVLENYKNHQAKVLKTRSVPRTATRPAEHFIAVLFTRPDFVEVAFARFKLVKGNGCSAVYSHRFYGPASGDQASVWLRVNGEEVEKALMEWNSIPSPTSLRQDPL